MEKMNEKLFLNLYEKKQGIIEDNRISPMKYNVILMYDGLFYEAIVCGAIGSLQLAVNSVKEVAPREVTKTVYEEVYTIKGTKEELVDRLTRALKPEIEYYYKDASEPYAGSIKEYEELSEEDIKDVAKEVLTDLLWKDEEE